MKLHEEFRVEEPVDAVWSFFEEPQRVAQCMPGVEEVTVLDADHVNVRATQSIGPLTATFEAKVRVLQRVPNESIKFQATGKTVRGAMGNINTTNEVRLSGSNGSTTVTVEGDVVLAGALGSVGQKIIAKQAGKVTAEFARNLERALRGEEVPVPVPSGATLRRGGVGTTNAQPGGTEQRLSSAERWSRIAAATSMASLVANAVAIVLLLRRRKSR